MDMNLAIESFSKPVVLVVCDGLGHASPGLGNAVQLASMEFFEGLMGCYPSAYLAAAGEAVGLLPGFIGNSEVGHLTLGAGRVVKSSIVRFHELIQSGELIQHPSAKLLRDFAKTGKVLHVLGLLSDGGVHSHELHLYAMLDFALLCGIVNIVVHPILDGRDVAPTSAAVYLERLDNKLHELMHGRIGSLQGRFYAMDRDKNWDRTDVSYEMMCGFGSVFGGNWQAALAASYAVNEMDEFVKPILFSIGDAMQDGDAVIFVNVRPDRALQLASRLLLSDHKRSGRSLTFVLTGYRYDPDFHNPVILEPKLVQHTLLDTVVAAQPKRPIFLLAETEKYAHVTYFFKGMRYEQPQEETRVMIPSLKVRNYTTYPQMKAQSITDHLEEILLAVPNALCVVNYANADMVGHSGDLTAAIAACQILDLQLKRVFELVVNKMGGMLVVTADHGNAEAMLDPSGKPKTAHTANPVPFVVAGLGLERPSHLPKNLAGTHGIAHVSPTLLLLMGIDRPLAMVEPLSL
jgi:2,3-bisphosphoglycerate-independent phosphoglycerate mutase